MAKTSNPFAKARKVEDPYFILTTGDWTWKVLKLWKSPDATLKDPYARAFCVVTSPMNTENGDMGDCYARDVPGLYQELYSYIRNEVRST